MNDDYTSRKSFGAERIGTEDKLMRNGFFELMVDFEEV